MHGMLTVREGCVLWQAAAAEAKRLEEEEKKRKEEEAAKAVGGGEGGARVYAYIPLSVYVR